MATGPWEQFQKQEGPWSRFTEQEETPAFVTPAPSTARTGIESVTDIGASLVSGLGGVLELPGQLTQLVPGLYGVGKAITEPATSLREFGEGLKSAGLKAREALRSKALSEAEKEGVLAEFTTAIGQTIKDPALLTSFVAEQLPQLLGPAAAAKVAKGLTLAKAGATEAAQLAAQKAAEKAAVRTGMAMQGVDISSDTLEAGIQAVKAQNPSMSDEQAAEEVINRARLAGLGGAAFSKLGMMLPGGKAIERRMAGLPGAGRVTGALGEAGSEMVEEGGGAFARNVALTDLEPDRGLLTGVGTAAGLGAIGGGTLGAAFSGSAPAPVDRMAEEREAARIQQELLQRRGEISQLEAQATEEKKLRFPEDKLIEAGIKKSEDPESLYQKIRSKDLSDPQQAEEVRNLLTEELAVRERPAEPRLSPTDSLRDTIANLEGYLGYPSVSQPVEGATGAGVPVAGVPGGGTPAEGVGDVETAGVVPAEQDVGEPAGREGQQPAAVKPEKKSLRGFYSALEEKVGSMGPKQAPAAQWKAMIQALPQKGVKPEEIEYSGVTDWLETQQGRVTKEQVQDYLKQGGVQVEETQLGGPMPELAGRQRLAYEYDQAVERAMAADVALNPTYIASMPPESRAPEEQALLDAWERVNESPEEDSFYPRRGETKYGQYTLPGGENYREVLLTLPEQKPAVSTANWTATLVRAKSPITAKPEFEIRDADGKVVSVIRTADTQQKAINLAASQRYEKLKATANYRSSHWDQPNVLAHIRVNDRVDADGKKVLFVEELQSDWQQAKGSLERKLKKAKTDEERAGIQRQIDALPKGPFVGNTEAWLNLALKRIINMAVEGGYDRVAFTTGAQNAERFSLDKSLREIAYEPAGDGKYEITATDLQGREVISEDEVGLDRIEDLVGKEIAEKVSRDEGERDAGGYREWRYLRGDNLKVEAKGMRAFYDTIVPTAVKKLLSKVGGQLGEVQIGGEKSVTYDQVQAAERRGDWDEAERLTAIMERQELGRGQSDKGETLSLTQPGFDITPAMKESVSTKGQPLFSLKTAAPVGAAPVEEPATPTEVQPSIESVIAQKKELQAQQIVLFEQALKKVASKYGLKDVAVKVIEDMRDANGAYSGGLIKMALDAQDPVRDIRHESIHALKELGFFSEQQWNTLVKQAKTEWIDTFLKQTLPGMESRYDAYLKMFQSQGMSDAQIEEAMIEEAIADAFSYFDANKAPAGLMQAILTRMRKMFKMLRESMGLAGIESAEDIFGKIEQGALEPTREVAAEAPAKLSIKAKQDDIDKSLNDLRVSPRMPTAKKATEDAMSPTRLQPDLNTFMRDQDSFEHNVELMSRYPNFSGIKGSPEMKMGQMVNQMVDNLLWLYNHWSPNLRSRSKLWYVGGNRIAHRWAERFNMQPEKVAAVIAALSPQKDWFQNVSLAERIIQGVVENSNVPWDENMTEKFMARPWGNSVRKRLKMSRQRFLDKFEGKTLRDLYDGSDASLYDMAVWLRAWDEANNPQKARVISPEGSFSKDYDKGKSGRPVALRAQSFAAITKALDILTTDSLNDISSIIGANHKVRSFYNNIIAPFAGEDVTIDTHAVAAALLRPLGSSDMEVAHNFGSGKKGTKGPKNSAFTGLNGMYAVYAEAHRRAAKEAGVLPREMQSITWEAVRGLFRPEQKSTVNKNATDALWRKVAHGEINAEQARQTISKLVGGITNPAWAGSSPGRNEAGEDSSYEGGVRRTSLPGRAADSGRGAGLPGGTEKLSLRSQYPQQVVQRIFETTTARDEKSHFKRMAEAIGPKSRSYFRQRALNRYNQLSVYDKRRAKLMGGAALLADQSAESAALLSDLGAGLTASALGVHDRVGGIPVFKNGITIISNMNGTVKGPVDIFSPIAKLGDPYAFQAYQFWAMVKRGKKYFAPNAQGQYVEKLLEPADIQRADFIEQDFKRRGIDVNAIQKEWIKYNDGLVKFMVDTGVLSKERADIYTQHADYFPFYRQLDEDVQEGPRVFQGISGVKAPKAAKGSEAQVGDFFEVIVRNTQSAIQAGIKNVAAERAKKVALEIGMAQKTHRTSGPDVFSVLENGVPTFYESADSLFIDAIKSLNLPDLPFIGLLSGPSNLLRNLVTKDPGFMLANMMRDSMSAFVTSGVKMTPVASTIKNFGSALASKDPRFERLLNAGILGGYEFSQSIDASGRQFAKELRKAAGKPTLQEQIMRPATWLWDALEKGTTASDAATRMEVYKKTLEETGNEAEAIYRALEVMNFNRKGSSPVVRIATAAIPFLNARMQGLDVLYRAAFGEMAIKDPKALQRAFFVRGMTIAALSTMYWALTHDDDEYKRQEQETRDNYWLFPSLGIKIPIPFEVGVLFKVIPERIAALTFGTDTAKDFTESMTRNLMNTLAVNPIPQVALPTVEYVTNFSFFTFRPIVGQGLEGVAKPYQIGPGTSRAAQFLGHISKDLPDALQISPMKADALINGYTGSIGTYMSDLIDAVWDMHADSPKASKRFEQMPIIRRFMIDPDARGNVTAYYDLKNAVDRATRTSNLMERSNDFEQYGEYMQENMGMFAVKDYILDLEKTMKEYREMKNMVRASNMDANTKRDMVLSITQMENQITENIQSLAKMARD